MGSGDVGSILGATEGTGSSNTINSINLAAGDSGVNYDFGVPPADIGGTISGTVFQDTGIYSGGSLTGADNGIINDTDADSFSTTPSTGEKRIVGVTIELYDNNNNLVATTTTDINGNYSFTGLAAGTYRVEETQPQYFDSSASNGQGGFVNYLDGQEASPTGTTSTNDQITNLVIVDSSTNLTANNFAELPPASISGYVFLDQLRTKDFGINTNESLTDLDTSTTITDINGDPVTVANNGDFTTFTVNVRNGEFDNDEFGIAGIELQLTGTDDQGNPVSATTTTDANGYYRFDGLRSSDSNGYTVTQVQPSDYEDGIYNFDADLDFSRTEVLPGNILGTQEGVYNDPGYTINTAEDNFSSINLTFGQSGVDYSFPEATSNGLITGKIYVDANNNGTYDLGEEGISGVTIELLDSSGNSIDSDPNTTGIQPTTTTTDAEGDYFFSVSAGTYDIQETQPANYDNGSENSTNVIDDLVVTAGNITADNNFGEITSSISGFVQLDSDGDSTTTTDDQSGLSNIEIQLLDSGGTVVATTRTRFDGYYEFSDLLAGTYSIQEIDTVTYSDASPADDFSGSGTSSSNSNNGIYDRITDITLGTATDLTNYNFYEITNNVVNGTASPEVIDTTTTIATTSGNDLIIGGKGEDTLTGGGGNDYYYFNETSEGMDTITDFTIGEDKIDISNILATEIGYTGSDPFTDNYVQLVEFTHPTLGNSTIVQIDFDPTDSVYPKDIAFLEGVTGITSADFIT